ncbi:phosphate ABC transporter substrate-binding protein PstS family protein [Pediococcus inopinatus]|uniref:Phosphate-binding protein n=1 Tax=Pediococcus inopinatus TaxID=114090 RepID=A0ABZ0Q561_9LACO|nr:phosphate ABC transporter substrate-binding protein PstS family protein [Pediococcus inopinatus]WPC19616.1 phosphate ABC transporter substrate-binding protein PstS family protein [Pediococcus inopinatus]WPC21315.1 phosphate ABC transporter substrate-binding protein PstS family protein [Pediococcus inopinatus]WPP09743.1 phosphate ABC transporter substrate-binding protein PstS family protein [Pediococcus inopinatus]
MKRVTGLVLTLLVSLIGLAGCGSKKDQTITIVGSTALQPLVERAANNYQIRQPKVTITVQGGGSGTGLSQVQAGAVTIGNSDVFAEDQDGIKASALVDHKVAVVGITPIVNKKVTVQNLSTRQLAQIFSGKLTNWKQVGGKNQKITVINRAQGSGIRSSFETSVLDGKEAVRSQEQDSNGTVQKIVAATPGAISYTSFSYVNDQVRALNLNGIKPEAKNVIDNRWQIWSYEHMYTKGKPNQQTQQFLDYIQSKKMQKQLITDLGYISTHDMQVTRDRNGKVHDLQKGV